MAQTIYEDPANNIAVIVPDDDTDLAVPARALICGSSGDLEIVAAAGGDPVLIAGIAAGVILPIQAKRVREQTTINPLIAIW